MTKHTNLDHWKTEATERGLTVHQTQGHEQFEARDGHTVVGRWNQVDGHLDDPVETEPAPLVDPSFDDLVAESAKAPPIRYGDSGPMVPETNVTEVQP